MGVQIVASGVSEIVDAPDERGAIALAVSASRACLAGAGLAGHDVDLLIYVGVYRDDNIVEPAIGALIQRELGMSLDFVKTARAGFSFDLLNSSCGVVNALQIAAAYLLAGDVRRVLIVSSDAHPSARVVEDFPIAAVGAALLLADDDNDNAPRFGRLQVRDDDDSGPGIEGALSFAVAGINGRDSITVVRDADYEQRALSLLSSSITTYVAAQNVSLDEVVIVASCLSPNFGTALSTSLGVAAERVLTATGFAKDPHTSALTIAWDQATRAGRLPGRAPIIFAAVGGGLTSACLLLRR